MTLGALWLGSCGASGVGGDNATTDWPEPSPALWEAIGPNGETAYLFGTIHALPDGVGWRTSVLEEVINKTDTLFVEIAKLDDTDAAVTEFEKRAYDLQLEPILDRVPEPDRSVLALALDLAEIDHDSMIHTESWAAALQLGNAKRCSHTQNGVDRALISRFENAVSFESFGEQFAIFDNLPEHAQTDLLMSVARERGCAAGESRIQAWLTGDLDTLETAILEGFRGNEALETHLLDMRNLRYANSMVTLHGVNPEQTFLIAVGAGHMLGDAGLPQLLEEAGYEVRRIQ